MKKDILNFTSCQGAGTNFYILERYEYRQHSFTNKHSARYITRKCLTFIPQSINKSVNQPYYKENETKEVILKQTCRSKEETWKCAGYFGWQTHESQPARDGERNSNIILRVILWEPIGTMEDQYTLFRVTSLDHLRF